MTDRQLTGGLPTQSTDFPPAPCASAKKGGAGSPAGATKCPKSPRARAPVRPPSRETQSDPLSVSPTMTSDAASHTSAAIGVLSPTIQVNGLLREEHSDHAASAQRRECASCAIARFEHQRVFEVALVVGVHRGQVFVERVLDGIARPSSPASSSEVGKSS